MLLVLHNDSRVGDNARSNSLLGAYETNLHLRGYEMESTHFYFAMMVSLVLLTLGWAVAGTASVGYSLMGLGCAMAGLALANRFVSGVAHQEPVPVPIESSSSQAASR